MNTEVSEISVSGKTLKGVKIIGDAIAQRNSTHTIVLLDTSGSMNVEGKLENVKKSLNFLLKFLQSSDYLSLVTFSQGSDIIIDNIRVSSEYIETFKYAIETLVAGGGTNLSSGLLNVKSIIERANLSQVSKTGLIILTDGQVNEGVTKSNELQRIVNLIKEVNSNISITTIGYGEDHNAQLLNTIATSGGGSYNVVNSIEEVATVFGDVLGGLMTTVAQNVKLEYPTSWNCINMYTKNTTSSCTSLYVGDVYAESETILLFENTDDSKIKLTGVNLIDYSNILTEVSWGTNISQNKDSYHMAYIRNAIAYILKNIKTMDVLEIQNTINPIKEYLNQVNVQFHPLTRLLKSEIENIENQLHQPSSLNETINLQTSAFLALGRGATVQRSLPRRRADSDDETMILNQMSVLNVTTPFSNRIQREITQQMSCMATDPTDDTM